MIHFVYFTKLLFVNWIILHFDIFCLRKKYTEVTWNNSLQVGCQWSASSQEGVIFFLHVPCEWDDNNDLKLQQRRVRLDITINFLMAG